MRIYGDGGDPILWTEGERKKRGNSPKRMHSAASFGGDHFRAQVEEEERDRES